MIASLTCFQTALIDEDIELERCIAIESDVK
jgi:hypothetical protein